MGQAECGMMVVGLQRLGNEWNGKHTKMTTVGNFIIVEIFMLRDKGDRWDRLS